MSKTHKILFLNTLVLGTLIAISSYSWFSMWMGLEINLLSAIPLFLSPSNMLSTEASMKYFISQAIASMVIMFSLIMITMKIQSSSMITSMNLILNSMLMLKMGAAPLHFWFPEVMEGLSWMNCIILLTWQKISPMMIITNNKPSMFLMTTFIVSSLTISSIMSFNQSSMRKIMAYSSINHIAWMLASTLISISSWILYFTTYSILTLNTLSMFKKMNLFSLSQMNSMNKTSNLITMINFLSMGGIPPLLGFLPKWIIINEMASNNFFIMPLLLILSSLVMLFVYMRIFFPLMMISQSKKKTSNKSKISIISLSSMTTNFSLLIFMSLINLN